jgi:hypothetical protein
VIARLEAVGREISRGADMLEDDEILLATDRGVEVHQVRQLQPQSIGGLGLLIRCGFGSLGALGKISGLGHQGIELGLGGCLRGIIGCLLQGALERADLLANELLAVAQLIEVGLSRPLGDIGLNEAVDYRDVFATAALGLADPIGVGAQNLGIDHGHSLRGTVRRDRARGVRAASRGGLQAIAPIPGVI